MMKRRKLFFLTCVCRERGLQTGLPSIPPLPTSFLLFLLLPTDEGSSSSPHEHEHLSNRCSCINGHCRLTYAEEVEFQQTYGNRLNMWNSYTLLTCSKWVFCIVRYIQKLQIIIISILLFHQTLDDTITKWKKVSSASNKVYRIHP